MDKQIEDMLRYLHGKCPNDEVGNALIVDKLVNFLYITDEEAVKLNEEYLNKFNSQE